MSRSITAPSGTEPLLGTLVKMLVPPFLWYGCQCRWASTEQAVRRTKGCFAGELVGFWVGNFLEHVAVEGFLCQPLSMSGCIVGERVEATARAPLGTVKVLAAACFPQQGAVCFSASFRRQLSSPNEAQREPVWACGEDHPWTGMGLGRWHARWGDADAQ